MIASYIKKAVRDRNFLIVLYKALYDILFCLVASMIFFLLLESVLPGIVSNHYGFMLLSFLIIINMIGISALGEKLEISFEKKRYHALPLAIFFAFVLTGNALLKFTLVENLLITTSTMAVFILLYQILLSEEA